MVYFYVLFPHYSERIIIKSFFFTIPSEEDTTVPVKCIKLFLIIVVIEYRIILSKF